MEPSPDVPSPDALSLLATALAERAEVITAYAFGSAVDGSPSPRDLDVAVTLADEEADSLPTLLHLQVDLEREVGFPIDLHELERLPVDLQFRIWQTGRLMIDRDPPRRVRTEIEIIHAYHDLAPYLERLRAATRRRLIAGAGHG